jgi:hypothetical protein
MLATVYAFCNTKVSVVILNFIPFKRVNYLVLEQSPIHFFCEICHKALHMGISRLSNAILWHQ